MRRARARSDPRSPCSSAVGQVNQRTSETAALEPVGLMAEALRRAARPTAAAEPPARRRVDTIAVVNILSWRYRDPARAGRRASSASPRARTIATDDGGNYPQSLLNQACARHPGRPGRHVLDRRRRGVAHPQAARASGDRARTGPCRTTTRRPAPRRSPRPAADPPGELARGIVHAACRCTRCSRTRSAPAQGWTIDEHRDHIAELWAGFSEVAAANPHAWIQRAVHGRGDPQPSAAQPHGRVPVHEAS